MKLIDRFRAVKQDVCLISETNSMNDRHLVAGNIHAESRETAEAWGLDSKQQCKDEKTGRYIQFVSSFSCHPVKIYEGVEINKADVALIASQTEDQELVYVEERGHQDSRVLWVGICLAMICLTTCIVILTRLL